VLAFSDEKNDDGPREIYRSAVVDPRRLWAAPKDLPAGLYYRYIVPPR
jgi:hypothetical protein